MGNTAANNSNSGARSVIGTTKKTRFINRKLRKDADEFSNTIKLLLLGTGESGKSTLLKQMKLLYGDEKKKKVQINGDDNVLAIRSNILLNLQELVRVCPQYYPMEDKSIEEQDLEYMMNLKNPILEGVFLDEKLMSTLERVWEDEGIQKTWEEYRNLIQIQDALPHFMNRFQTIFSVSYKPTEEDWLRVRVRTSGITESNFELNGVTFKIVDVGGQRSERKKWLHCFSEVNAIIYVTALSEYDQNLMEDTGKNRMMESLDVFEEHVNSPALKGTHWIVFLNKSDLYREKLNKSPIKYVDEENTRNTRFVDFEGPHCPIGESTTSEKFGECYEAGVQYFRQSFFTRASEPKKIVTNHVTCAMDQHNVHVVFNAVRGIIINDLMGSHGIMRI